MPEKTKNNLPVATEEKTRKTLIITAVTIALLLIFNFFTNYLTYGYHLVKCGRQPIITSRFMAAHNYYLPGKSNYEVNMFNNYFYCTEQEAKDSFFTLRLPISEELQK